MTAHRADLRPVSRLIAAVILVLTSPVLVLTGLVIRLSSRGPVIYRAARLGLRGRPFTMYKFRTMSGTDNESSPITAGDDARIFPVGRVLRRYKLDELPQLVNVLRGEMALVGPRPEAVSIVRQHYTPFMIETLDVLPGLTSPGSLAYFAEESALPADANVALQVYVAELLPRKIARDLVYVRNRSWRYDAELVCRTVGSIVGAHTMFRRRQNWEVAEAARLLSECDGGGDGCEGSA